MFRIQVFEPIIQSLSVPSSSLAFNKKTSASSEEEQKVEQSLKYMEVSKITFDPTQMILVASGSNTTPNIAATEQQLCPI